MELFSRYDDDDEDDDDDDGDDDDDDAVMMITFNWKKDWGEWLDRLRWLLPSARAHFNSKKVPLLSRRRIITCNNHNSDWKKTIADDFPGSSGQSSTFWTSPATATSNQK